MSEWANKRMTDWHGWLTNWMNEWMDGWINERMDGKQKKQQQ